MPDLIKQRKEDYKQGERKPCSVYQCKIRHSVNRCRRNLCLEFTCRGSEACEVCLKAYKEYADLVDEHKQNLKDIRCGNIEAPCCKGRYSIWKL